MDKMNNCKACGQEIAKGVKKCPHCGKDQRNFFMKHKIISVILAIVIIAGISTAMGGGKNSSTSPTSSTNSNKSTSTTTDTKITYENFLKIQMGQKYSDVVALIGEGKEQTSSEVSGIKTVIYTWNGTGISNMNVTIQNDIIMGKAQLGLKSADDKITLDKYNQVKEGMTYAQTKAVLGDGQIVSETKVMDTQSVIYEWINKDSSNANFTFSGDKLQMKAQFNLK